MFIPAQTGQTGGRRTFPTMPALDSNGTHMQAFPQHFKLYKHRLCANNNGFFLQHGKDWCSLSGPFYSDKTTVCMDRRTFGQLWDTDLLLHLYRHWQASPVALPHFLNSNFICILSSLASLTLHAILSIPSNFPPPPPPPSLLRWFGTNPHPTPPPLCLCHTHTCLPTMCAFFLFSSFLPDSHYFPLPLNIFEQMELSVKWEKRTCL